MSVFDTGGPKGPGFITRIALRMPTSASLWKWMLPVVTFFWPLVFLMGDYPYIFGFGFSFALSYFWGWFLIFPFGPWYGGPLFLLTDLFWIPVLIALLMFNRMVKNRTRSRIAGALTWYYFLLNIGLFIVLLISAVPSSNFPIPIGLVSWFLVYLRYKQLNYYLDLETPKVSTPKSTVAPTALDSAATDVKIASGYDFAGENLKLAVKVNNEGKLAILNVTVNIDAPDGFEFTSGTLPSQKIGNINSGSFQSAIFWLKPLRCVDDEYGGSVIFRDAENKSHTVMIPRKRIVNVCPMLEGTNDVDSVFKKLKFGSLARNCASFKFNGSAKTVYELAKSRLRGLDPVDTSEQVLSDGNFLGYACFVGQTKFGDQQFAAEVQTTGTESSGVLTLSIYSDDERILSGYMVDVMTDVREHVTVVEEQACPLATCPKCGADIDPTRIDENRVYICNYCGGASKAAPWLT
ncbi:MAG: hypothetical protein ACFFEK_08540 [Candidatus Thorarchaeota archaeon]